MSLHEDNPSYEVEAIVGHATTDYYDRCDTMFMVQWRGYSTEHNLWLPMTDLAEAQGKVKAYLKNRGLKLTRKKTAGLVEWSVGKKKVASEAPRKKRVIRNVASENDTVAARDSVPFVLTTEAVDIQHEFSPGSSISIGDNRTATPAPKDTAKAYRVILTKNARKINPNTASGSRSLPRAPVRRAESAPQTIQRRADSRNGRDRRSVSGIKRKCYNDRMEDGCDDPNDCDFKIGSAGRPKRKKHKPKRRKNDKKRVIIKEKAALMFPDDSDDPDVIITEETVDIPKKLGTGAAPPITKPASVLPRKSLATLAKDLEMSDSEDDLEPDISSSTPSPASKDPVKAYRIGGHNEVLKNANCYAPDTWSYTVTSSLTGQQETWTHAQCVKRDCAELVRYYVRLLEQLRGYPVETKYLQIKSVNAKEKAVRSDLRSWKMFAADERSVAIIASTSHPADLNYHRTEKTVRCIIKERRKIIKLLRKQQQKAKANS